MVFTSEMKFGITAYKKGRRRHFRLTCAAQKRLCLKSLVAHLGAEPSSHDVAVASKATAELQITATSPPNVFGSVGLKWSPG